MQGFTISMHVVNTLHWKFVVHTQSILFSFFFSPFSRRNPLTLFIYYILSWICEESVYVPLMYITHCGTEWYDLFPLFTEYLTGQALKRQKKQLD